MKSAFIVVALLLVSSLALGYDREWSNHYEEIAAGPDPKASPQIITSPTICDVAHERALAKAKMDDCKYPVTNDRGTRIGVVERCSCQCVDNVCICTDKLDVYCIIKDTK